MSIESPFNSIPPQRHGLREKIIRLGSRLEMVDRALRQRAEWMITETGVQKYLAPKIVYKEPGVLKPNNIEKGVNVLCIGAGKGHEMDEIDQVLPGSTVLGLDPHDYITKPVAHRLDQLANDATYLSENVRAEHLEGIADNSLDGVTFNFVLHHIDKQIHDKIIDEIKRVLKKRWLCLYGRGSC